MAAAPSLTPEQAKTALNEIWARFQRDESRQMFESLVAECNQAENPLQAKMLKFPPAVQSVCADLMAELGFNETTFMMGIHSILFLRILFLLTCISIT